jgi:hypothetical protein
MVMSPEGLGTKNYFARKESKILPSRLRVVRVVSCKRAVAVCGSPLKISIVSIRYLATTSDDRKKKVLCVP